MRRKYVLIWCLFLTVAAPGQQTKTLTFTGRVIDYNARPVAGATVVCYDENYENHQRSYKPLERVQTTSDGQFSLQVETENSHHLLVASKQGLASAGEKFTMSVNPSSDLANRANSRASL